MAHFCPDCGAVCMCHGDTARVIVERAEAIDCEHCGALEQLVDENPEAFDYDDDDEGIE